MAQTTLPRFMVLYAKSAGKYVNYTVTGGTTFRADSDQISSPVLKLEVVQSTVHSSMVHIRCCYNNKYLALKGPTSVGYSLLNAYLDKPVDDQELWSSTLFQPEFLTGESVGLIRLLHVYSGYYAQWDDNRVIRVLSPDVVLPNDENLFKPVDWESLVTLPRHVAFIDDDSGLYLGLVEQTGAALRFWIQDEGDKSIANDVVAMLDGSFRFENVLLGAFWKLHVDTGFIWADEDSASSPPTQASLFRASKVVNGLNANGSSMIPHTTHLILKELVTSIRIEDIKFHVTDSWIYDETTDVVLNPGKEEFNDTSVAQTIEVKIPYIDTKTSTWNASTVTSLKLGPTVEIQPDQIPHVTDSSVIELTTPFDPSYVWGETTKNEPKEVVVHTVTVQPMSKVTLKLVATSVTCHVPFTYTRYDVLDEGGDQEEIHVLEDGVYTGINYIKRTVVEE